MRRLTAFRFVWTLSWLLTASSLRADDYESRFHRAETLSTDGKYDEAIEGYKEALALRPGAAEALNNLAVMYYAARRYADAYTTASGIWKKHPEMKSAALIAGMAAVQCNRPQDAVEPLETLVARDPDNRDAILALASAQIALKHYAASAKLYERRTGSAPQDADAWYGLAICYERMAEDASRNLSHTRGGASYSQRLLGQFLMSIGDERLAREAFGEASATPAAESSQAAALYASVRDLAGKSRSAFERFVNLSPDSWQAAVFFGDVHRQHNELTAALEQYKKAAGQQPDAPGPLLGMGTVYWELGDFDNATKCLQRTLALKPESEQAVFELANISVRRQHYQEAVPLLKEYVAVHPDALAARADLGLAYVHLEQYEDAVQELTQALSSDTKGEIHYQLSIALRKLGRAAEADESLRSSVEIRKAALKREQHLVPDR